MIENCRPIEFVINIQVTINMILCLKNAVKIFSRVFISCFFSCFLSGSYVLLFGKSYFKDF